MWGDPDPDAITATGAMLSQADHVVEQLTEMLAQARVARAKVHGLLEAAKAGDLDRFQRLAAEVKSMQQELATKMGGRKC